MQYYTIICKTDTKYQCLHTGWYLSIRAYVYVYTHTHTQKQKTTNKKATNHSFLPIELDTTPSRVYTILKFRLHQLLPTVSHAISFSKR